MRKTLLIFSFSAIFFCGCKKLIEEPKKKCFIPYIDFVVQHVDVSTLEVSFTAVTSSNATITSYKWDFGDGTTFDGPNPPPHKYPPASASKTYTVKYTVSNECGQAFWTKEISLSSCLPDTKFSFTYLNDSTVQFANQTKSNSTVNYVWSFGDGTTSSSSENTITHIYNTDKAYTVSLKATNSCGENNYTGNISVCRKPVPAQTVKTSSCGKVTIDASATKNGAKYQWNFGNGIVLPTTASSTPTIEYTYPNAGNYTIKLVVYNASGCDSATVSSSVNISAGSALVTNSNWSYTSTDLTFNFSREAIAGASTYSWNFGDGTSSALQNPETKTYNNPGTYTITLSAANSCGVSYQFSSVINVPYYKPLNNTPSTGFQQVLAVSPSLIYFLGTNGKLYTTDTAGHWSQAINLPTRLAFNNETRLFRDRNGELWIYGKKEVAKFNESTSQWKSYFGSTGFSNSVTINSMAIDNNNELWTIGDGKLRRGNTSINSQVAFSSLAFASSSNRIWLSTLSNNNLYFVNANDKNLITVFVNGIVNGSDDIKVYPNGDLFFTTGNGIVRTNSSGAFLANYSGNTTNGFIAGRPTVFDFDKDNLWVIFSGRLFKLPIDNSGNTKKYSFNTDLDNLAWVSVLPLSNGTNNILLAKTSGNAAIKIR